MTTSATSSAVSETVATDQQGEGAATRLLTERFEESYARVFAYLVHRFFDRELAEELTSQTMCRAAESVGRFRGPDDQFAVWLLRIATNLANTHLRRRRWRRRLLELLGRGPSLRDEAASRDSAEGNPARERVRRSLLSLPAKYQAVVVLRYYSELSFDEIGSIVGCRPEAVRKRLSRAIQRMRGELETGGSDD